MLQTFAQQRNPATVCSRPPHLCESLPQFAGDFRAMAKFSHRIKLTFAGVRNPATVLREKFIKVNID